MRANDWTDPVLGRVTFADQAKRYLASAKLRPTTRALNEGVVRKYLIPRFGGWPIASITRAAVKAMVTEEEGDGHLSASAIRRHVFVLSGVMRSAIEEDRISRNPAAGIALPSDHPRAMRFLTAEELVTLADSIRPQHYRPLVLTAGLVGLRWGELAGLRLERVDLLRRRITIEEQLLELRGVATFGPPKTRAGHRTVTIPTSLVRVLAVHFATDAVQRSRMTFPTPSGGVMSRSNFRRTFRRACAAAGFDGGDLDGFVFHELPTHGGGTRDRNRRAPARDQGTTRALVNHGHHGRIRQAVPVARRSDRGRSRDADRGGIGAMSERQSDICSNCGTELEDPIEGAERPPCPNCGSFARTARQRLSATVKMESQLVDIRVHRAWDGQSLTLAGVIYGIVVTAVGVVVATLGTLWTIVYAVIVVAVLLVGLLRFSQPIIASMRWLLDYGKRYGKRVG
jgi:integrase/predicted RNA-binding Zn-ribbon protein involved in translation (DUF1610 family)